MVGVAEGAFAAGAVVAAAVEGVGAEGALVAMLVDGGRSLEILAATGADELMVTTVAHGLDTRLRSLELLATTWTS